MSTRCHFDKNKCWDNCPLGCYADCLDSEQPLTYTPPAPREDAPLKVIVGRCHSHRPHSYPPKGRRHEALTA